MALRELTLEGERDKVQIAIDRLKAFEPPEGYYVAFSGGKDSQCIYHLCVQARVKFDAHYSITSVDPPELIRFIKKYYPDVSRDYPRDADGKVVTMWNLIPKHTIPPTRMARYCCAELKETNGKGRVTVTGVRWAESARRKKLHGVANVQTQSKKIINEALQNNPAAKLNDRGGLIMNDDNDESRRTVEQCYRTRKVLVNPIVDWTDEDVWEYLNEVVKVPHCELYDQGITRIGCIGCPLAGSENMKRDFERYPKYKENYIRAFDRMIKNHPNEIRIATGEPADIGGVQQESEHGSSGAEMDDTEYELNKSDFGGGITDNAEYSDGGTGTWESRTGRTSFDGRVDQGYEGRRNRMDMDGERQETYKVIRTGEDEMAFFLKDDVDQPIEQGVLVKRVGYWLGRKR